MTHREFEELTKVKVSDETYTNTIEPAYMLDDMDKQSGELHSVRYAIN